jgi:hypothetical protein
MILQIYRLISFCCGKAKYQNVGLDLVQDLFSHSPQAFSQNTILMES